MHQNPQHSRQEGNGCARIIYQKWWCKRCRKKSTGKCHGKNQQGHSSRSVKNAESKVVQTLSEKEYWKVSWKKPARPLLSLRQKR